MKIVENNMINKINFEHPYLNNNVLPYLGNKKEELQFIDEIINKILKQYQKTKANFKDFEKIDKDGIFTFVDLFSGSGIVSRYAKLKGFKVIANDLENYAKIITEVPIRYYKEQVNDYFENVCKKLSLPIDNTYEENKKSIRLSTNYCVNFLWITLNRSRKWNVTVMDTVSSRVFFECYHLRYKIFIFFSVFHFSNGTLYSNDFYIL